LMQTLLLRSYAGSILHGLESSESDTEVLEVYATGNVSEFGKVRHEIHSMDNGIDLTRMSLSRFMERAMAGSHQALDAMFSSKVEVDLIGDLRRGFHCGHSAIPVLIGTIREM